MRKVLAKNPQIEQKKLHRRVFLDNIDPENQALLVRSILLPNLSIVMSCSCIIVVAFVYALEERNEWARRFSWCLSEDLNIAKLQGWKPWRSFYL